MMDLFAFGVLAGIIFALIFIGGMSIAMDKGESNKSCIDNDNNNEYNRDCGSMDRHTEESKIKEIMLLEHAKRIGVKLGGDLYDKMFTKEKFDHLEELVNRLRAMKVVTGLCRTEKETLEEAADFISEIAESTGYFIEDNE